MSTTEKRTIDIATDDIRYLDSLVASGVYPSSSEAIGAGLRALKEREAAVDRWIRDEVLPVVDLMDADPGRAIPADEVFEAIRELHAERAKPSGHGT